MDRPFDLTDVPYGMQSDDGVDQANVLRALAQAWDGGPLAGRQWEDEQIHDVRLSRLRRLYNSKDSDKAIALLSRRTRLQVDQEYTIPSLDPSLTWSAKNHFLDFKFTVSRDIGLAAFIPNTAEDHNFSLPLDLTRSYRLLTAKYGKLGFDPSGACLFLGMYKEEEAWFVMRPRVLDPSYRDRLGKNINTRLSNNHCRMIILFLSLMLSKIEGLYVTVAYPYGRHDSFSKWKIKDCTNVMYVVYDN